MRKTRKGFGWGAERDCAGVAGVAGDSWMTSKFDTVRLKPHIKQVRGIAFKPAEVSDSPFDGPLQY